MDLVLLWTGAALGGAAVALWMSRAARTRSAAAAAQLPAQLRDQFAALSAEALRHNNQSFLDLARTAWDRQQVQARGELEARQQALERLVKPVGESLDKMSAQVRDLERARSLAYGELREQVRGLGDAQQALRRETENLVKALRAPAVRGRWGEIQLRRVVELAGMVAHCDFVAQESVAAEDGRLRPDLVVRLPGGKHVVVDVKTPLQSYLAALEAGDEAARLRHLRDHARAVREHVQKLSAKGYWAQFEPAPEFVVLFLPGETFFGAALEQDPSLIEHGVEHQVILATPTTLIALLRAVAYGWRQERIAESARAICAAGRTLYERLRTMGESFAALGRSLDRAVDHYNHAVGSLESRVLPAARRFEELGATPETGARLEPLEPVERTARPLQAPDLGGADRARGAVP